MKMNEISFLTIESNKPRDKKPLEPTYSNAQKLSLLPKKG